MKAAIPALVTAAVLVAAALVVPAAEARTGHARATPTTTHELRVQLRRTQAKLAHTVAQLAKARKRLAASRAKAQGLEARLAAIPTPLAIAIAQVQHEVDYVQGGVGYSRGQLVSEAALDYVVGHVSDTEYGYLEVFGGAGALPARDPESALAAQAGFCVHAAVTFTAIVKAFGFQTRNVQFFYDDPGSPPVPDSHVAVEVFYDGAWHFFDPTFGQFWADGGDHVLSITDVRAGLGTRQKNLASFTNVFEDAVFGDDSWFETDPATTVVIGGSA